MSGRAKGYVEAWRPQKRTQILLGITETALDRLEPLLEALRRRVAE